MKPTKLDLPTADAGRSDLPAALRQHLVEQQYAAYGTDAQSVWRDVLARNEQLIDEYGGWMHPAYIEGMRALELPRRIPRTQEVNERLEPTGWKIVSVDGYIPTAAYAGLMSRNIFPVSRAIRRPEHVDFAPAPDMVHDILGHLPMLFSSQHRDYLKRLATVMTQAIPSELDKAFFEAVRHMAELKGDSSSSNDEVARAEADVVAVNRAVARDPSELTCVRRMYVWSIEFGLIGDRSTFWIHGAALLSSPTEFRALCEGMPIVQPYSLDVIHHENEFSDMLEQYFVARDFFHLTDVLAEYEKSMTSSIAARASEIREIQPEKGRSRNA